jgi:hypothetical protein
MQTTNPSTPVSTNKPNAKINQTLSQRKTMKSINKREEKMKVLELRDMATFLGGSEPPLEPTPVPDEPIPGSGGTGNGSGGGGPNQPTDPPPGP